MATIDIDASSTDGMDTGTDVDDYILSEDWSMKEYSLGKACFDFTLMMSMVSSSDVDESWPEFDSRFAKLKRESSYKTILENVQDKSPRDFWRDGKDDHEELMVTLGAILRRGDASLRDWTMNIIKQRAHYSQPERFKKNGEISIILPKTDYVTDPLACGEDIKALKEYGDQIGEVPKYKEVSIQAQPPRFRSILCFKGQVFEAEGKRKKIARQNVAHKACNVLSVAVGE